MDDAETEDGKRADGVGLIRAIRVIRGRSTREESVETDRVDVRLPGWVQGRGRRPRMTRRTERGSVGKGMGVSAGCGRIVDERTGKSLGKRAGWKVG